MLAFLSERVADDYNRLVFIAFSLPVGAIGLILIGLRLFGHLKSRSEIGFGFATSVIGALSVATIPSFFHTTDRPDQYACAAAWPFVLLGMLGLVLIATVLISHLVDVEGRRRYAKGWVGIAIALVTLAWLDSSPTSTYLPMLDWRVRSILIFTCFCVGAAILAVIASWVLLRLAHNSFAKADSSA